MNNLKPGSFEEFEREARGADANVIAVVRTVATKLAKPVDAFARLAANADHAFLFESVEGGESVARHSFAGIDPWMIVRGRGDQTIVERSGAQKDFEMQASEFIRDHFRARRLLKGERLPPLAGGAVGFLGFQATRWFEPAFNADPANSSDDAVLMFFRTVLSIDRMTRKIKIASVAFTDEERDLREQYEQAVEETARYETLLATEDAAVRKRSSESTSVFESNWSKEGFEAAVEKVKNYIRSGDCYQVVLSQRFSKKIAADPIEIYRALRSINPSPYMFFLKTKDQTIIGGSPEMLVRCRGRNLEYRPIAGTRPRGATPEEDQRLSEELINDEKEMAEHVMLVDLGRNDLGRVAEFGSVAVEELMNVERYSHVQHMVSSLRARLRPDLDRFDALASCFPAGTVTGAPKIRAMEIIRELEPEPRGIYAGAVLYVDYAGNLDSCIAIRTLVLDREGCASVQAGAGIVADSVPAREYEETVNKASGLFRAVEVAEASRGYTQMNAD